MMKIHLLHPLLCLVLLLTALSATGCQQSRYINDPKTGQVLVEGESKLKDGTYSAHSAFRDNGGYGSFLFLCVKNGIITKASFSEKDESGKERNDFSESNANKNFTDPEDFYQALEASLITHQGTDELPEDEKQIASDFKNLADTALKNAESGITANASVNLDRTYTASGMTTESVPRRYKATITFKKGNLDNIDFDIENGTLSDRALIGEMTDRSIKSDSLSEVTFNAKTPDEAAILGAYNAALTEIATKRVPVQTP